MHPVPTKILVLGSQSGQGNWYAREEVDRTTRQTTLIFFQRERKPDLLARFSDKLDGVVSGREAAKKYLTDLGWTAAVGSPLPERAAASPVPLGARPNVQAALGKPPMKPARLAGRQARQSPSGSGLPERTSADRQEQAARIRKEARKARDQLLRAGQLDFTGQLRASEEPAARGTTVPALKLDKGTIRKREADAFLNALHRSAKGAMPLKWSTGGGREVTLAAGTSTTADAEMRKTRKRFVDEAWTCYKHQVKRSDRIGAGEFARLVGDAFDLAEGLLEFDDDERKSRIAALLEPLASATERSPTATRVFGNLACPPWPQTRREEFAERLAQSMLAEHEGADQDVDAEDFLAQSRAVILHAVAGIHRESSAPIEAGDGIDINEFLSLLAERPGFDSDAQALSALMRVRQ